MVHVNVGDRDELRSPSTRCSLILGGGQVLVDEDSGSRGGEDAAQGGGLDET